MIEIRTLGRTSIAVDGEELSGEAAWPRSLALIVYMAREPGPDRREEILGVLWPDREEKRARRALNQLLYTLRKANPELDLESTEGGTIDFGTAVWLDVEEFERRLEAGDLKAAVELYAGPFLADLRIDEPEFDHWADRQRAGLRRQFRKAALRVAEEAKAAGDYEDAVDYCRRLLESDPLDDEAQHLLIESLYLRGDRVAALRQYEVYRDLLARELEVEPLEHTLALVERIRSEPGVEPAGAEAEPEAEEPAGARAASRFGRRALAGAAAVAAVVLLVFSARFWLSGGDEDAAGGPADVVAREAARIAVLPFQTHGAGAADAGLAVGVAQLLALDLDGLGPIHTVDHRALLERWEESGLGEGAPAIRGPFKEFVRDLGATSALLGDVYLSGDRVRLVAELVGAGSGASLARADVRGARDSLFELADEVALQLLDGVWTAADMPAPRAAARGTRSLAALKHYVRAEIHYRRAEWDAAVAEYREAVRADSAFLPAVRSLAETILWAAQEPRPEAAELFRRARRLAVEKGASERDRAFDDARSHFTLGDGPAAVRAFEELGERYPEDFSIQYQLADAYFHFGTRVGLPLDAAARQLESLLEWDSAFAPAMDHLWWVAMWRGDEAATRRWADAYMRAAPQGTRSGLAPIATALRYGDEVERRRALERLARLGRDGPALAVLAVSLGPEADPDRAREIAEWLLEPDRPRPRRALGAELMAALDFATGRPESANRYLAEARALGLPAEEVAAWRALAAVYGLSDGPAEAYPAPGPLPREPEATRTWVRDAWLHGAVGLRLGDRRAARRAARALAAVPAGDPAGVVARSLAAGLLGELALAAGDTAAALAELRRSAARYPELALLSAWETVPCYRYRLGELEAARGRGAAAVAAFRSLADRSLGDLLYRAKMHLALARTLEAMGEPEIAAASHAIAARWWRRVEPGFAGASRPTGSD